MSQRQFAERHGISHSYLAKVERGDAQPRAHWLKAVTDALAAEMRGAA